MKNRSQASLLLVGLLVLSQSASTDVGGNEPGNDEADTLSIDPRPFVSVFAGSNTLVLRGKQTKSIVDIDSEVLITFDKRGLANLVEFSGNLTVAAQINERKVEVAPYTEVGEDESTVGTTSKSPLAFAQSLTQFLSKSVEIDSAIDNIISNWSDPEYLGLIVDIGLVKSYLLALEGTDADTKWAFSVATNRDPTFIQQRSVIIINAVTKIDSLDVLYQKEQDPNKKRGFQNELSGTFTALKHILKDVISIQENLLAKLVADTQADPQVFLARLAGSYLYSKLVDAKIDLDSNDAKEGDKLVLNILVYSSDRSNAGDDSPRAMKLPLGVFKLKETGWKLKVNGSFLLVDRFNESMADTASLSPSLFKGAAGTSMLFSYSDTKRGVDLGRFVRMLEPSVGINVSYIDFRTDKDLEIGVGPVLGLFRNKIFVGFGANLNNKQERYFWYLGFSFIDLAAKLSEE